MGWLAIQIHMLVSCKEAHEYLSMICRQNFLGTIRYLCWAAAGGMQLRKGAYLAPFFCFYGITLSGLVGGKRVLANTTRRTLVPLALGIPSKKRNIY